MSALGRCSTRLLRPTLTSSPIRSLRVRVRVSVSVGVEGEGEGEEEKDMEGGFGGKVLAGKLWRGWEEKDGVARHVTISLFFFLERHIILTL